MKAKQPYACEVDWYGLGMLAVDAKGKARVGGGHSLLGLSGSARCGEVRRGSARFGEVYMCDGGHSGLLGGRALVVGLHWVD
jgi:hypothetical protein